MPHRLHPGAVILAGLVALGSISAGPSGPVLGFALGLAGSLLVQYLVAEDKRQKFARVARDMIGTEAMFNLRELTSINSSLMRTAEAQKPLRIKSAGRFLRRVLDREDGVEPRVLITDKLASYAPAIKRVLTKTEHRRHKRLNNRAENSHRPVRKRERAMQRFKSPDQAQRFLETFSTVCNHFRPRRHRLSAERYRQIMRQRFQQWREIARLAPTA